MTHPNLISTFREQIILFAFSPAQPSLCLTRCTDHHHRRPHRGALSLFDLRMRLKVGKTKRVLDRLLCNHAPLPPSCTTTVNEMPHKLVTSFAFLLLATNLGAATSIEYFKSVFCDAQSSDFFLERQTMVESLPHDHICHQTPAGTMALKLVDDIDPACVGRSILIAVFLACRNLPDQCLPTRTIVVQALLA